MTTEYDNSCLSGVTQKLASECIFSVAGKFLMVEGWA